MTIMTKAHFDKQFKQNVLPHLKEEYPNDKTAWRTAYNDEIDVMNRNGYVSDKQAQNWTHPQYLK
jgi:hypothetical protein